MTANSEPQISQITQKRQLKVQLHLRRSLWFLLLLLGFGDDREQQPQNSQITQKQLCKLRLHLRICVVCGPFALDYLRRKRKTAKRRLRRKTAVNCRS